MELVAFLAIDGVIITIATVVCYETLRVKWQTASTFVAAGGGAITGSIVVATALGIVLGMETVVVWSRWATYIAVLGGLLGFFTGLSTIGLWEGLRRNGWYGTAHLLATVLAGALLNEFFVFGSVAAGEFTFWLFSGGR